MKFIKLYLIIFICITSFVKVHSKENFSSELKKGGKLIFIRHAYAPGGGDPSNFDIKDCSTQRNLNHLGKIQAKKIGDFFKKNKIDVAKIYSSEWCRCKETALIAFKNFETKKFLNSFFSPKFAKNKLMQINNFKKFIESWDEKTNLVFVTHYVFIMETLNYTPSSGEIVISDKDLNVIDSLKIQY